MKKLLLTSDGLRKPALGKDILEMVGKPASKIKVVFVFALRPDGKEPQYIQRDREGLLDLGIPESGIKKVSVREEVSYSEIKDYDLMYVCGGNTFYIMHHFRKTGFDKVIKQFVKSGKVYVGVSAGSILMGPNIDIARVGDTNEIGLKDLTGLNIVDIVISPHAQHRRNILELVQSQMDHKITPLDDGKAFQVIGDSIKLI